MSPSNNIRHPRRGTRDCSTISSVPADRGNQHNQHAESIPGSAANNAREDELSSDTDSSESVNELNFADGLYHADDSSDSSIPDPSDNAGGLQGIQEAVFSEETPSANGIEDTGPIQNSTNPSATGSTYFHATAATRRKQNTTDTGASESLERAYTPRSPENEELRVSAEESSAQVLTGDILSQPMPPQKRAYRFVQRSSNTSSNSSMRAKWVSSLTSSSPGTLSTLVCCKRLNCFSRFDPDFLRERMLCIRKNSNERRRLILQAMLTSNGYFSFDGSRVCCTFLEKAFRFSRVLQMSVKETTGSHKLTHSPGTGSTSDRFSNRSDTIVSFIQRTAESVGDKMPDRAETHLPFRRKKDLYALFCSDFKEISNNEQAPTKSLFYRVWKEHCGQVKIRKFSRFSKCAECDMLESAIREAIKNRESTDDLKRRKVLHSSRIKLERVAYSRKRDEAKLRPHQCVSVIIDGADQSAFGLPHFSTTTKDVTGHALKVRLIGLLEHSTPNRLHLYTLTEEHETGSNHIVESLHRFINDRNVRSPLPPLLYVQLDNCTRENKNRYFLGFVDCLVSWGVFESVEVGFLPVGHTHEDIDQAFSCTSSTLRNVDAITLNDLHARVKLVYNDQTCVSHMKYVANWKELCNVGDCVADVEPFSNFQYFKFSRAGPKDSSGMFPTKCDVKHRCDEQWRSLKNKDGSATSFIIRLPNLHETPKTKTKQLTGREDVERRIKSEDTRINSPRKRAELEDLVEFVFTSREDPFHWDLSNCVEYIVKGRPSPPQPPASHGKRKVLHDVPESVEQIPVNRYEYDVGSFVAARTDTSKQSDPFWIGCVSQRKRNKDGHVIAISVRWYEPILQTGKGNARDIYNAKYKPAILPGKQEKPWRDTIPSDSVMWNFPKLTSKGCLPVLVQRKLRE